MDAQDAPTFSIVMPLYNQAAYVPEALGSILTQTCQDWELIVVNDGSTDGSEKTVEQLAAGDPRIRLFHQPNAGCSAARATGLHHATGEWLAYLDSDDVWYPTTLADFQAYFEAHPSVQFIYGYRHRLNANGTVTELPGEFQDRPTGPAELFQRMFISHLCVCYRRELLLRVGGYDPALLHADDYDLYLRMSLLCPLHPLGKPTGLRRRHAGCLSRQTGFSRMVEGAVLRRFLDARGGRGLIDPALQARRLGKIYYSAGRQYFKGGYFPNAVEALRISLGHRKTAKAAALRVLCRLLSPFGRRDTRPLPKS